MYKVIEFLTQGIPRRAFPTDCAEGDTAVDLYRAAFGAQRPHLGHMALHGIPTLQKWRQLDTLTEHALSNWKDS